jgi:hypothetical protein
LLLGVFGIVQNMGLVTASSLAARLLFSLGAMLLYFIKVGDEVASPSQRKCTISSTSLTSRSFSKLEVLTVVSDGEEGEEDESRK